jgi:transcriptional regulator of aromatic amino acid metabolism
LEVVVGNRVEVAFLLRLVVLLPVRLGPTELVVLLKNLPPPELVLDCSVDVAFRPEVVVELLTELVWLEDVELAIMLTVLTPPEVVEARTDVLAVEDVVFADTLLLVEVAL